MGEGMQGCLECEETKGPHFENHPSVSGRYTIPEEPHPWFLAGYRMHQALRSTRTAKNGPTGQSTEVLNVGFIIIPSVLF